MTKNNQKQQSEEKIEKTDELSSGQNSKDHTDFCFYVTSTLPYVNAKPHVGHIMEFIRADVVARHKRLLLGEKNVFFNTGTDEHGQKLADVAKSKGLTPKKYVDEMVENYYQTAKLFGISYDNFILTTDKHHTKAAQEF